MATTSVYFALLALLFAHGSAMVSEAPIILISKFTVCYDGVRGATSPQRHDLVAFVTLCLVGFGGPSSNLFSGY